MEGENAPYRIPNFVNPATMKKTSFKLSLASVVLLAACASDPPATEPFPRPPPPPTKVFLKLEAAPDVNPDSHGRQSPVLIRIYELKEAPAFKQADFFDLLQKDTATLGADLVHKQEFLVRPGETREIAFEARPDSQVLAVFAAFRNLPSARWRDISPLKAHMANSVEMRLTGSQLEISSSPPRSRPAMPEDSKNP